ncbi:hypothetical protein [Nesterenkonia populi]
MAKPFGVRDVVGGRYRITHHVVTSADQDIVFQATDEALGREVSVLLASRSNAKQVATSARELAAGERDSEVEVLDLGLAEDRTYLISTLVDPNQLLDLVVPDAAPFVEPYFTDSLGSEIFGQSREMQPQTYDDDAEYYARLHESPNAPAPGWAKKRLRRGEGRQGREHSPRRRPSFLDKAGPAPTAPEAAAAEKAFVPELGLLSDLDEVEAPAEKDTDETLEAAFRPQNVGAAETSALTSSNDAEGDDSRDEEAAGTFVEDAPSQAMTALPSASPAADASLRVDELVAEGEEVIDNPPEKPDPGYSRTAAPTGLDHDSPTMGDAEPSSFTSLITSAPKGSPTSFPSAGSRSNGGPRPRRAGSAPAESTDSAPDRAAKLTPAHMISAGVLVLLVILAAIIIFSALQG